MLRSLVGSEMCIRDSYNIVYVHNINFLSKFIKVLDIINFLLIITFSVQLARRVLNLERANTSLRHDIEREVKKRKQISEEVNHIFLL